MAPFCEPDRRNGQDEILRRRTQSQKPASQRRAAQNQSFMKLPFSQRVLSSIGIAALVVMLALLALLQYRWSRDVSEAAGARMRASLQSSMVRFREDFSRELGNLAVAVQSDPASPFDPRSAKDYVRRITTWKRVAVHPDLLQNVYVFERNGGTSHLLRLNTANAQFEPSEWPPSLARLEEPLTRFSSDIAFFDLHHERVPNEHGPGEPPLPMRLQARLPWMFDENDSVLLHLHVEGGEPDLQKKQPSVSWILIELNESVIRDQIFPQLARANFVGRDGLEYDVAVVDKSREGRLIYASGSEFDSKARLSPDAEISVLGGFGPTMNASSGPPAPPMVVTGGAFVGAPPDPNMKALDRPPLFGYSGVVVSESRGFAFSGPVHLERFRFADRGPGWTLMAKHRKGSLESALASMHRRQLAISFGVLLLLAITMAMIIVATRRAQRLATLQMDFVTGVSHELRTPLAVIGSAAENIADGIIDDKAKLKRYGGVIRDQARQLSHLVEQILLFAATRQDHYHYNLVPVAPSEIVKLALENSAELIRTAGFTAEQDIQPSLPLVMVDLPAISQCLQNLIVNAVKYGGGSRRMWVHAAKASSEDGTDELQIAVVDNGIGIAGSDLQRIFDPFYRSPAVTNAQIHGTGLGLALAKSIAEAMHGRLSATSELGKGSSFVLHLPFAAEPVAHDENATVEEISTIYYEPENFNR